MPPEDMDNDIPEVGENLPMEGDVLDSNELSEEIGSAAMPEAMMPPSNSSTGGAMPSSPALQALGARAIEVFSLGLESVATQKPQVSVVRAEAVAYSDIAASIEADTFGVEIRFALNEAEAHPIALLVPFEDMGRIFMMNMSAESMADDTFAAGQVDLVSQATRELLDLAGLMLFIDDLAGGEATLAAVRLRGVNDTIATLQSADSGTSAMQIDLILTLPDGSSAQVTLLVPSALITRLASALSEQPVRRVDPPAPPRGDQPNLRAVGGAGDIPGFDLPGMGMPNMGGQSGPERRAPIEPEVPVYPVRFPPITAGDAQNTASQMDLIMDVPLRVSVELGRSSMTVEEVLALGPGSVIELNKLAGEPVDVLVNDRLIARGEVVVVDENFGVRVTEVISPRSRVGAIAR